MMELEKMPVTCECSDIDELSLRKTSVKEHASVWLTTTYLNSHACFSLRIVCRLNTSMTKSVVAASHSKYYKEGATQTNFSDYRQSGTSFIPVCDYLIS